MSRCSTVCSRLVATIVVALCALSVGCAGAHRTPRSPEELAAHRDKLVAEMSAGRTAMSRLIVQRILNEQDSAKAAGLAEPVVDVLILSGGGDFGAFGAGVLKGWGTVKDPAAARPVFDLVTGVSTGALIAPLAFVGSEESYERAYQIYQDPKPDWFKQRGLVAFIFRKEALIDTSGLRREIERTFDDPMLRAIAQGHAEHRMLVIGTSNLDLAMLTMWDAALIAHQIVDENRARDRFDNVVLASASIPAIFPPVEIDGDLYVDGGVTRNIAYATDQESPNSAINIWKREHSDRKLPKFRFWVLINNQLATPMKQVDPGWPAIMGRSLEMSIRASTISSLKGLATAMQLMHVVVKADVEFRYMAIPDDWRAPVEGAFKKETMVSLAQLGYKMGADPGQWKTAVPNPESPGE